METTTGTSDYKSTDLSETFNQTNWLQDEATTGKDRRLTSSGRQMLDEIRVIYLAIGCFGTVANAAVGFVIGRTPSMRRRLCNKFILNQSMVDFITSSFLVALTLVPTNVNVLGLAGFIKCAFWVSKYPFWSMAMTSTYCLLILTLERYVGIVHPFWHRRYVTKRPAIIIMVLVWFIGPTFNLVYVLTRIEVVNGNCQVALQWDNKIGKYAYAVTKALLGFFLPLFIMLYCYIRMLIVVQKSAKMNINARRNDSTQHGSKDAATDQKARARQNVIFTLVIVCACFVLCWCWNEVYMLSFNLGYLLTPFDRTFYHFSVIMVYCNCCVNPIVYSLRYREFQSAARKLFLCCSPRKEHTLNDSVDTTKTSSTGGATADNSEQEVGLSDIRILGT